MELPKYDKERRDWSAAVTGCAALVELGGRNRAAGAFGAICKVRTYYIPKGPHHKPKVARHEQRVCGLLASQLGG